LARGQASDKPRAVALGNAPLVVLWFVPQLSTALPHALYR